MYGPASAPGMRTRHVSIFKYLFRKKGVPHNPADIWQPGLRWANVDEHVETCVCVSVCLYIHASNQILSASRPRVARGTRARLSILYINPCTPNRKATDRLCFEENPEVFLKQRRSSVYMTMTLELLHNNVPYLGAMQ